MPDNQPYPHQWWCRYFDVPTEDGKSVARMKQNIFTRTVYVFQRTQPTGNRWNEHGYGYGRWMRLDEVARPGYRHPGRPATA